MEINNVHVEEADKATLKQKALSHLPRNLGDTEAQRQILKMVAQVVPAVAESIQDIENLVWARVESKELPINQAIAQCAYRVDRAIGSVLPTERMLETFSEETLLKAWIALDYYAYVLKAEYSFNIRSLHSQLSTVLLTGAPGTQPQTGPEDYGQTQPIVSAADQQVSQFETAPIRTDVQPKPAEKPQKSSSRKQKPAKSPAKKKGSAIKGILLAAIAVALAAALCFLLSDTRKVTVAIREIGTVTLDSEDQIVQAEQLYSELTESQQDKVSNRDVLFAAREEYDSLVTEKAINDIGKVTMESKDAIVHAETLYNALSRNARNLVDNYKTLTSARKEFDRLEAAIKKASDAIDAIGTVTLQSGSQIETARNAYDALKKDNLQSYLSGKVATLTDAEKQYKQLVSQDLYDTGMSHYEQEHYEDAIVCFDSIIADYSDTDVLEKAATAKANCQTAQADQAYGKRDYYAAMKTLNSVDAKYQQLENYLKVKDKVIAALTKARPNNSAVIDGKINWGRCYFQITAGDQDVCFKFQNTADPSKYKLVFVRAGEKAKVNVEDGIYSIKWATGQYWYSKDLLFGDDTVYRSKGTAEFTTTYKGNWVYFWYLDLDMSSSDFRSSSIDAKDF